jgi:anion-transporting  ArsA/GET3 family ATPase
LTSFLDNRIFRLLVTPTRAYLRAVSVATQTLLRTIARVVGSEVVSDAIAFFHAFEGMERGFRDRADAVLRLLGEQHTGFLIVTTPCRDAIDEAVFFADRLGDAGLAVDGLIVNRLHPTFGAGDDIDASGPLAAFVTNLADFRRIAEREEQHFADLADQVAPAPIARVPFLADDVHDLDGLGAIEAHLFPPAPASATA